MSPQPLSLLLLTHNSSSDLKKNFTWLKKCSRITEIVVIDDKSTDNSKALIKNLASQHQKVKIWSRGLMNNYSSQRNFGLAKITNDWLLWLDPDEQPSKGFIDFINHFDSSQYKVFSFPRTEFFLKHQLRYGETPHLRHIRLFHKSIGTFINRVHEFWLADQKAKYVNLPICHYGNSTLKEFLHKINLYSSIRAEELFLQKTRPSLWQIIFFPLGKFVLNYFLRLGFLDSTPGIIFALGLSFHSFLVRAKLWHLWQ
jgi:glycosyltransferase involved in cell wall biosynthesis